MMKAILITGYPYSECIDIVDVKETEKSYIVKGIRFMKGRESGGRIGYVNLTQYEAEKKLYKIDDEGALQKLDQFNIKLLKQRIVGAIKTGIDLEQAYAIADILGVRK